MPLSSAGRCLFKTAFLLGLLILVQGCKEKAPQSKPALTLNEVAKQYVRLAFALGEHDKDSLDYYFGDPAWVEDLRKTAPPLSEVRTSALELTEVLNKMHSNDAATSTRLRLLEAQLESVACRASLLAGARTNFDEETRCSFGVTLPPGLPEKKLRETRAAIDVQLPGKDPLDVRYAKFESQFVIPPGKLEAVMSRAIAGCRSQTARHMALPEDESIEVEFTSHKPWAAYSLYVGHHKSVVTINTDLPITIDRAVDLACHETYPGHHTFNMAQDDAFVRNGSAPERSILPTYSPLSFSSEGMATIASDIAFTSTERLRFEEEELLPISGISGVNLQRFQKINLLVQQLHSVIPSIAREYIDGRLEFARASAALEQKALMGGSFDLLKYFNEFRTYVVTYTFAPDVLAPYLPSCAIADAQQQRWATYSQWMRTASVLPVASVQSSETTISPLPRYQQQEFIPCAK